MTESKIEWTDRSDWNPIRGCTRVSPGCGGPGPHGGCYAEAMAARFSKPGMWGHGIAEMKEGKPRWTGKVELQQDRITLPLKWRKPEKIFVSSTSDVFHEALPDEAIDKIFAVMALCPQHMFQVLTKRAARMRHYLIDDEAPERVAIAAYDLWSQHLCPAPSGWLGLNIMRDEIGLKDASMDLRAWPLPNVWLGVSTERQQEADERIPLLLQTPAAIRFISAEPLLDPIELYSLGGSRWASNKSAIVHDALAGFRSDQVHTPKLDWVIVGGESGPKARPMHPEWVRRLRDQCNAAAVAFFFKQWGEFLPVGQHLPGCGKIHGATGVKPGRMKLHYRGTLERAPDHAFSERGVGFAATTDGRLTFRVGKKAAGRLLDGVEHNDFPTRGDDHGV